MSLAESVSIVLATVALMEAGVTWVHRYVMHGPGWSLHRSHHMQNRGGFELNDIYSFGFSLMGFALFVGSVFTGGFLVWIALGYALYGLLYFVVHDGLVHHRLPLSWRPKSGYLHRLLAAHHLHHRFTQRLPAVSYGFLYAPPLERLQSVIESRKGGRT